jgi:hypothetical protein
MDLTMRTTSTILSRRVNRCPERLSASLQRARYRVLSACSFVPACTGSSCLVADGGSRLDRGGRLDTGGAVCDARIYSQSVYDFYNF